MQITETKSKITFARDNFIKRVVYLIADMYEIPRNAVIFREVWAYYSKALSTPDGARRTFYMSVPHTGSLDGSEDPDICAELESRGEIEIDLSHFPPQAVTHLTCKFCNFHCYAQF